MTDEQRLQPLQEYFKPTHSSLLAILLGPALLIVAVFLSGQEFPPIFIYFLLAAAVFTTLGHFLQRRDGNRAVLDAAERYGATTLAEDFRAARSHADDQLRVGRKMLYSKFAQGLWPLRDLESIRLCEVTDSDGDKCLEMWCTLRHGGTVRVYYTSSNSGTLYLQSVCDSINHCITEASKSQP